MTKQHLLALPLAAAVLASLGACATPQAEGDADLTGVWRMTTLEIDTGDGFEHVPYSGEIAFTDSSVSVQAANPDTAAADTEYTVEGYEAFYGDLTVDEAAGTFEVEVESAVARALVGQTLVRNYEIDGSTLILTPADPAEGWRVRYELLAH